MRITMKKILLTMTLTIMTIISLTVLTCSAASVKLSKTSLVLTKGYACTVSVKNYKGDVTWSSSDKSIATVSSSGRVTAKSAGTCYIYAKAGQESLKCTVRVKPCALSTNNCKISVDEGSSKYIYVTTKNSKNISVASNDTSIAKAEIVSWKNNTARIKITGINSGNTSLKIYFKNYTDICKVINVTVNDVIYADDDTTQGNGSGSGNTNKPPMDNESGNGNTNKPSQDNNSGNGNTDKPSQDNNSGNGNTNKPSQDNNTDNGSTDKPSQDNNSGNGSIDKPSQDNGTSNDTNQGNNSYNNEVNEVLRLVNEERKAQGKSALVLDDKLCSFAQTRTSEINSVFSHSRPDGRQWYTVFSDNNYSYSFSAENIAKGYTDADSVMTGWMNSSGHRANILSDKATKIGIAFDSKTNAWVQLFAA